MRRSKTKAIAHRIAYGLILGSAYLALAGGLVTMRISDAWPHQTVSGIATHATGDCAPIEDRYVSEQADGYHVNLPIGAHPKLKTKGYSAVIPYSQARKQPLDNNYHLCISEDGAYRYCFFPKPGAV